MRSRSRRLRINPSEAPEQPAPTGDNPGDDRREVINIRRNTPSVFDRLGRPEIYRRFGREALEPPGSADPPFTPSIMASPYPSRFKMPTIPSYDGSTDADEHLENYQTHMLIQSANEAALCNFQQLVSSFSAAFLSSRTKKLGASHLFGIKQRENETLKKYLERFDKAVVQVEDCTDDTLTQALKEGINDPRLVWTLAYDRPTSFTHLKGIAWRHAEADEYVRGRELEVQDQERPSNRRSERGQPRNSDQNRQDKGKNPVVETRAEADPSPRTPAGRFRQYTPLVTTIEHVLNQGNRAAPAAQQNPGPSNHTEGPEPEHIVHTIFGRTATGDTASSRRSYAREARRRGPQWESQTSSRPGPRMPEEEIRALPEEDLIPF
ncbi:hypothetical protein TIFTF001_050672 [Ficus carica]|uniref:Retrotransposon gag domain-containing protein n=1 Tax=Ficus carica TaxID=3494 RepID=A0AA87Z5L0_FICCA|nr:hypothetical protein TIFTF001_050672 [Ficus carica]